MDLQGIFSIVFWLLFALPLAIWILHSALGTLAHLYILFSEHLEKEIGNISKKIGLESGYVGYAFTVVAGVLIAFFIWNFELIEF